MRTCTIVAASSALALADRRFRDVDASSPLAAEFKRHGDAACFLRRFLFVLERSFGIQPLSGDGKVGEIDRPAQAGGRNGGVGRERAIHRGVECKGTQLRRGTAGEQQHDEGCQ